MDPPRFPSDAGRRLAGGACFPACALAAGGLAADGRGTGALVALAFAFVAGMYVRYRQERRGRWAGDDGENGARTGRSRV